MDEGRHQGQKPRSKSENSLTSSFRCAWDGICFTLKTQRNPRIHTAFALLAIVLGFAFSLSVPEWLALINTALEQLVDLVTPKWHELAMHAKDCAAGAVLISAIGSLFVGIILFAPRIIGLFMG